MKKKKLINYVVYASLIIFLIVVFVCPFIIQRNKFNIDDFKLLNINPYALVNTYFDNIPIYNQDKLNEIINTSDLILKVELNDYYQDYTDNALVECKVNKVIKGNYDKEYIKIHDNLLFRYTRAGNLMIENTRQYLPMIKGKEYYVVLSNRNPKFYEYTNVDFGRINCTGDLLYSYSENLGLQEISNFPYDFLKQYAIDSPEDNPEREKCKKQYEEYLMFREQFLNKIKEMENDL